MSVKVLFVEMGDSHAALKEEALRLARSFELIVCFIEFGNQIASLSN